MGIRKFVIKIGDCDEENSHFDCLSDGEDGKSHEDW